VRTTVAPERDEHLRKVFMRALEELRP